MQTRVQLERSGVLATITLVAPAGKPPTLDGDSLGELAAAAAELAARPPRVVILRSSEPKYFCVGANLKVLEQTNEETIVPWVRRGHEVLNQLEDLPCPVVARVSGYAMGGGLELAMACDLIFAATDARFAQSEAGLGFIPGWGGTLRLAERIGAAAAKQLFFAATMIEAGQARELGLVDEVCPPERLDAALEEFAAAVAKNSSYATATFKRLVNDERRAARARCAAAEAEHSRGCLRDPETKERLQRFLTKRR
jgi:enoyl-CoA hydratase